MSWLFGYEFLYIYLSAIHTGGGMLIYQKLNRLFTSWIKSYLHVYFFWFYGEPVQDFTELLYFSGVNHQRIRIDLHGVSKRPQLVRQILRGDTSVGGSSGRIVCLLVLNRVTGSAIALCRRQAGRWVAGGFMTDNSRGCNYRCGNWYGGT